MAKQPLLRIERQVQWTNVHRNISVTVERLYDVTNRWSDGTSPPDVTRFKAGLAGLSQVVRDAEAAGKRVRAFGGGWSLSKVATTGDYLVNTKLLNAINVGFKASNVHAKFTGDRQRLVFAQCGTSVMELNRALEPRGLSLPTSGASNGQTICGAISTGTHGSNREVGAMQDFILGLHVVAAGGQSYFIERKSRPVVTDAFCAVLGATPKRDDNLFNAAIVGLGSFGLVHAVVFEAVPSFSLERYSTRIDYEAALPVLSTLDFSTLGLARGPVPPTHFEVVINPYAIRRTERGAHLRYMYQLSHAASPAGLGGGSHTAQGQDVLGILGAATLIAPGLSKPVAAVAMSTLEEGGPFTQSLGDTFAATTTAGFIMSCEIGVAQSDARRAVEAIIGVAGKSPWPGLCAVRYVKASPAFMAFTRFAPVTCTIELPSAGSSLTAESFERVWDELERLQIPYTLHWGQMLRYDAARIKAAFGTRVAPWLAARRAFLSPSARNTFSNSLLQSAGLAG